MKKLKLLFMACAMLGSSAAAWAQTDVTSSVGTSKEAWGGTNTYGMVPLVNGTTIPMVEHYYNNFPCDEFPLKQTITVENGVYLATLYAHSNLAWKSTALVDGATDEAYIYAKSSDIVSKTPIIAHRSSGIGTINKYDVAIEVTDGKLELGLGLVAKNLTEWHTIQIYSLTKYNSFSELTEPLKAPLKNALDEANSYYTYSNDNNEGTAKAAFKKVIDDAQSIFDKLDTYEKIVAGKESMETAIANLKVAYQVYALSGAMPTEGHPFDITFKLTNPSFSNNNADGWDCVGDKPGFQTFGNAEYFEKNFNISQTISGLPQAYYKLKVKAFQRPGDYPVVVPAYVNAEDKADGTADVNAEIYVNSGSQKIKNIASAMRTSKLNAGGDETPNGINVNGTIYYVPNDMNSADKYFAAGYYENEIELICLDGTAKMGFRCENGTGEKYWTIFDDFRIYLSKPIDNEAFLTVYRNAIAEAKRAMELHPDVKGKELATLKTLIDAEEPNTPSTIQAATKAIEEATAAYIAAEESWKRYAIATETATAAGAEFTDISEDNTKTAENAITEANTLFTTSLNSVKNVNTEGKTLGFEAGEWTLYLIQPSITYVNTLLAEGGEADAEKVKAADATAMKDAVTAIKGWKANETEVNALANGNFANTNIESTGWIKTASWANLRGNGEGNWWSVPSSSQIKYGESDNEAFKLSLKPNTVYYIDFKHSKWDTNNKDNGGFVSVLNNKNEGLQRTAYEGTDNTKQEHFIFKTGAEQSNYVLTVEIPTGRGTFSDFEIKKAVAEDYITIDEAEAYTPEAKYANVTLKRKFVDGWNGLVLPFDMTIDEAKAKFNATDVKDFAGITTGTEGTTLNFTDATEIKAGKPVMIKTSSTDTEYTIENAWLPGTELTGVSKENGDVKYTFTGTYAEEELAGKKFTLINGKYFYNYDGTESTVKAKSFRAYFLNETPETAAAKSKIIGFNLDGDTTGISEIKAGSKNDGKMFDMQGRRVLSPAKGLYIQNGKKVIVK